MPPFRNPFGKKPPVVNGLNVPSDENTRPSLASDQGSQRSSYATSRASSSLSIKNREEPNEYKLSVVNDSGVYLPPSPTEKKSFWARSPSLGHNSSNHRSMLNENEPFSISRESFESYRRSFDISARSPIPQASSTPRQSLESKQLHSPRSALKTNHFERPEPTPEDGFEDVGLNEEARQPQKKKRIFSRFGDSSEPPASGDAPRPTSSHRGFHLPGRKRGQSGQGAELGDIEKSATNGEDDGIIR